MVPLVLTGNDLAVRRDNAGRGELFIYFVVGFSCADDPIIHCMCAYDFAKFFKSEIVYIFFLLNNVGLYKLLGFFQQRLFVNEVAANDAVFWIFAIADQIP